MNTKMFRAILFIGVALIGACPAAYAQWFVHASQTDVFGNQTVVAADSTGTGDGLAVQCNQKDTLDLAYIFPATPKQLGELSASGGLPVTLLLKVDNGAVVKFAAMMKQWNNTYAGFVVSGRNYATVQAIKSISNAQSNISVGVNFLGNQQSDNFSPEGSTVAMTTVMKDCQLDGIKKTSASADEPSASDNN